MYKIFWKTYANQTETAKSYSESNDTDYIPGFFNNDNYTDVTKQYDIPQTKCEIALDNVSEDEIVYLCNHNYGTELNPVAWGIVKNDSVDFGYIGVPAFYVPAVYSISGKIEIASMALLWPEQKEHRQFYNPDLSK